MKTIGIVDITTVGATIAQRRISELGGALGKYPEFAVHSLPFVQYREAVLSQDWKRLGELVAYSIERLDRIGVDFIIVPSNTPHYAYAQYTSTTKTPVLNLIEITAKACQAAGLKQVAILGTEATMTGGLYESAISSLGMNLVVPEAATRQAIHHFIVDEIIPEKINASTKSHVEDLVKAIDCDGYILGCTELPEVFSESDLDKPSIDTTRLLAEVAFNLAAAE